jgi:hypothetical protein
MAKQYRPVTPVRGSVRVAQNTRTHKPRVRMRDDGVSGSISPISHIVILISVLPGILEERFD